MQEYERVAFEPERASPRQGDRDRWSEGEKLQAEPNQMGRVSPRTTILVSMIVVVVILCVLLFFLLLLLWFSGVRSCLKRGVPRRRTRTNPSYTPFPVRSLGPC